MTTRTAPARLASLLRYLDNLTCRASVEQLEARLRDLEVTLDDVAEYVRFGDKYYLRNLVCDGPWYHLLALCWRSGQRSPIHNHALSTCGVRVLEGVATETVFEMMPCGLVKAVNSHDMLVSDVVVAQDAKIHQISNLQLPGHDLVTLHVYSPPLLRMDTYSLTEREVGEYRPMVLEQAGSGI
ncbi:MAG: cysteine dioxygenase family protein [Planctomycetota bacterium]